MTMILKDGKFYKDGIVIAPEIGNQEQIRLLKITEENIQRLTEGTELDYDTEITVTYSAQIKCICGTNVFFEQESDEEDNPQCLKDIKKSCRNCKKTYKTYMENGWIMVKLDL